MILRAHIAGIEDDRELIRSPAGRVTRDAIAALPPLPAAAGARIALCVADPAAALTALAVLDGTAEHVVLLSPGAAPDLAARLAADSRCDAILCDDPDRFDGRTAAPAFDSLSALADGLAPGKSSPETTRWVMTTSGTTGVPKLVSHTLASLSRSARTDPARGRDQRWGLLYDYTRFAGLQVLLQSVLSGAMLIAPAFDAPLEDKLAMFAAQGCTHLSGTPTLWRRILMTPGHERLALKQVTLGGEIADDRILAAVAAAYPGARVAHIFASTEAGVGFSVADGRAGFPETYLSAPPSGVELCVRNGRLHVRNLQVSPAYLGSGAAFAGDDGWVDTGDAVERRDGRVHFLGRANGVINVGGDKVHPEEVERVLLSHPAVAAARVYAKANPISGALVAAEIVPSGQGTVDAGALRDAVRAHAVSHLDRHKVPVLIRIVAGFAVNPAGKLMRTEP